MKLVEDSLTHWLAAADELDAFDVALALPAADDGERAVLARVRLLLLAGRPQEALVLLSRLHITHLPTGPATSWPDLLLAACRAASGDPGAYRWLLSAVAALPDAWQLLYLVGAAAEQCGDYGTADQAWTSLVRAHGVVTGFTLARHIGAVVARRDQRSAATVAQAMIDVVEQVVAADPDVHTHPQVFRSAAGYLRRRGDQAGAALLLHTASNRLPDARGLPAAPRRRKLLDLTHIPLLAPAASLAVWTDWPPLVLTGAVPVLLVHRLAAGPEGDAALRAVARLRQGPAARGLTTENRIVGAILLAILLTGAVPVASVLARSVTGRADAIARTALHAVVSGVAYAIIMAMLTAVAAALMAVARRHNWRSERHRRQQADRHRLTDAGDCRCWRSSALAGSYAAAYLERHLVSPTPVGWLPGARLARCPTTGTLWLATAATETSEVMLLRGAGQPAPAPAPGGYL
ncbi:hypothetical protein JIG36_13655 [Actinoplanes sp. LDG1-06]|uniref:Uncharacterized protein n=1 Tax=Paractinoplanes ovalisporus TaxID=2810368 RepID=A0ABS2A9V3_9ACTN|nr:hypothetical protein [Actinoplanes ovalisporus]MBM2616605.1 hypothetical protein [Actinoplanes ovalisporus]